MTIKNTYRILLIYLLFLYGGWILAWLLYEYFSVHTSFFATESAGHYFWLIMKFFIWLVPSYFLIRHAGKTLGQTMKLNSPTTWKWGLISGSVLAILAIVPSLPLSEPLFDFQFNFTFLNAVIIAPVIEELAFRGIILRELRQKYRFWKANIITALLFLGIHLPGWYFQERLWSMLTAPVGGAIFILFVSLIFGWIAHKSKSVGASTLAHIINNLFNL